MKKQKREDLKKEMENIEKNITELYNELNKINNPSDIVSDRIKSEINRLTSAYNYRKNLILTEKFSLLSWGLAFCFVLFVISLFVRPKVEVNFTFTVVVSVVLSLSVSAICILLLRHFLSSEDRIARRTREYAEAEYLKAQKDYLGKTNIK